MSSTTTSEFILEKTIDQTPLQPQPLRRSVQEALQNYFGKLGNVLVNNLYEMVLAEIEAPLLDVVMRHTKGNQSKAANLLGISRGTLRKKLKTYGFL